MEITLAIIISIIGCVISICSFVTNRKDKNAKDTGDAQYKMGVLQEKIDTISKQIDKILDKLDSYDNEIDEKIGIALSHHIKEYHKD